MHLTTSFRVSSEWSVLPARSLGGDLLKLSLSVGESNVELLGAGDDGFSA